MENQLFMLSNITLAVRARNILESAGIHGFVEKTPKLNGKTTCGYSVFVPKDADKAEKLLRQYGFVLLGKIGRSQ